MGFKIGGNFLMKNKLTWCQCASKIKKTLELCVTGNQLDNGKRYCIRLVLKNATYKTDMMFIEWKWRELIEFIDEYDLLNEVHPVIEYTYEELYG